MEEKEMITEEILNPVTEEADKVSEDTAEEIAEVIPSMDEFADELEKSFHKHMPGDIVSGPVIGISDSEVIIDLGSYAEGIIKLEELSNDPRFSIKADIAIGEIVSATVLREDREGNLLLSRKRADDLLAWEALEQMKEEKTVVKVKIAEAVKGGVTTFLKGIRAFIPASQLSMNYVEDTSAFVGKELSVVVITVDEEDKKLVLSAKEVEKEAVKESYNRRVNNLIPGTVVNGVVEKLMPFGAFVQFGDGLSGLVHISQISEKRLKSPAEVLKEGDNVTVKILEVKDGKISLSIKAATEKEPVEEELEEAPFEYSSGGEATTGLAALLKNIKLQ